MKVVKLHCVFSLEHRCFMFSMDDGRWQLDPPVLEKALADAEADFVRAFGDNGDGKVGIEFGEQGGVTFSGSDAATIRQMLDYIHKVYDGWHRMTFANDGQNRAKP